MTTNCTVEGDYQAAVARALLDAGSSLTEPDLIIGAVEHLQGDPYLTSSPAHTVAVKVDPLEVLDASLPPVNPTTGRIQGVPTSAQALKLGVTDAISMLERRGEIMEVGPGRISATPMLMPI